jgi:HEXXH motif-containing protein
MTDTPTLPRHRLRRDQFEALAAGGGSPATVAALLAAERSWRMLQLRAVLDAARTDADPTGPLPSLDEAWGLLVAAERRAPSEVEGVLLHPQAGTWAGYALRRLRGSSGGSGPLWVDIGYLHALAAAAAIRAGLDSFSIRIPSRDGFASIPTLGGAFLPSSGRWDHAEVRGSGGTVTISAAGTVIQLPRGGAEVDGWVAPPVVRAESGGQILSVTLDHLDPYRNLRAPTPPDLLSAEQVERWQALLVRAWELIVTACPDLAGPIARGLFSVVPQPAAERFRTMSASAGDAFGSMIVSEPEDAPELAVTIVHEFQHIKLGGLLHLVPLHRAEPPQRLYAPWRDDPRPLGGLLQGVYAFVGIVQFWRQFRHLADGHTANLAHFEFARWRRQVQLTIHMIQKLPELTEVGQRLIAGLAGTAAAWQDEPVPADILAAAEAAAADHRMRWRLHHLRPDPTTVAVLAAAWRGRSDRPAIAPSDPVVAADGSARRLDTMAALALWRFTDPEGFAQLCKDPSTISTQVSGASPADLAYASGDEDRARELFLTELAADPTSPGAWSGLGLVLHGTVRRPFQDTPELIRAVHLETTNQAQEPTDSPLALLGWLAGDPK